MNAQALPIDAESERFLCGAVWCGLQLGAHDARAALFDLEPEAFYLRETRGAWAGMRTVATDGLDYSELTLARVVHGGASTEAQRLALVELLADGAGFEHAPLSERVRECSNRRVALRAAMEIVNAARDMTLDPKSVMDTANGAFLEIAALSGNKRYRRRTGAELVERLAQGSPFSPLATGSSLKLAHFGLPELDSCLEAGPGHVLVIGARPGCGKTALGGIQLCCQSARMGIRSLFVSLEMDDDEVECRFASWWSGVEPTEINPIDASHGYKRFRLGEYDPGTVLRRMRGEVDAVALTSWWCHPSDVPVGKVAAEIQDAVVRDGVQLVVIDYFQLLQCALRKGQSEASGWASVSRSLKRLAQDLGICIVILSQLNRELEEGKEPYLSHLKETSQLEQDANAVVFIWRKLAAPSHEVWAKLEKSRSDARVDPMLLLANWPCNRFIRSFQSTSGPCSAPPAPRGVATPLM